MMGLLFLLNRSLTYGPVVTFLAALISMELIIYLEKEAVFYGIVAVYVLACFFAPGLIFFLPVHRVSPMEKMPGSNRPMMSPA